MVIDFKIGDKVKFKKSSTLGALRQRQGQGQIGTVTKVYNNLPGQAGPKVDIEFADGEIERGISIHQIEHA